MKDIFSVRLHTDGTDTTILLDHVTDGAVNTDGLSDLGKQNAVRVYRASPDNINVQVRTLSKSGKQIRLATAALSLQEAADFAAALIKAVSK